MNLLVLTYHYFHRKKPSGIKNEDFSFSVGLDDFDNHCAELISSGYGIIDPNNIADSDQYRVNSDRQVLITIDDGHTSVEEAVEIILRHKLKPVLNVIPGLVRTANYLNWSSLRNLAMQGFSIQSHSMNHHNLTKLDKAELIADLDQSKKSIEDNIGLPVNMITAPMGRINKNVVNAAIDVGYEVIMTSYTGINRDREDLKYLKRFQVKGNRKQLQVNDYFRALSGVRLIGAARNLARKIRDRLI
jgi:peptidoglycan/xylan/chitin deacetylase (PgdA/CDA1 family)